MQHPLIIQGGMGVGISNWRLARAVAQRGQLGVVSGTGMDTVLARRLQAGDPDEQMRHALAHFPAPEIAQRVLDRYFIPGGKPAAAPFKPVPMYTITPSIALQELTIVANFAEVFLAKEGHSGAIGINLLEKIQLPTLASLYGAMLAGVDYVLMGAGIPREIPAALDGLAEQRAVSLKLHVAAGSSTDDLRVQFDPQAFGALAHLPLQRPRFLAIIASTTLALTLAKKATGRVDGFVIEGPTAGGHNAPPRGAMQRNERGEPIYGERDVVDLDKIKALGVPFWLAGSYGAPGKLQEALAQGAAGIQVGTAFALCQESGLADDFKQQLLQSVRDGTADVMTDPDASPTGFPFKIAQVAGTLSDADVYAARTRVCDLGYLRTLYTNPDGSTGFRCPAEPVATYQKKGGAEEDTVGRKCLCNALMATIGLGQQRADGVTEPALVTAGDELQNLAWLLPADKASYTAADVIDALIDMQAPTPVLAHHPSPVATGEGLGRTSSPPPSTA